MSYSLETKEKHETKRRVHSHLEFSPFLQYQVLNHEQLQQGQCLPHRCCNYTQRQIVSDDPHDYLWLTEHAKFTLVLNPILRLIQHKDH